MSHMSMIVRERLEAWKAKVATVKAHCVGAGEPSVLQLRVQVE